MSFQIPGPYSSSVWDTSEQGPTSQQQYESHARLLEEKFPILESLKSRWFASSSEVRGGGLVGPIFKETTSEVDGSSATINSISLEGSINLEVVGGSEGSTIAVVLTQDAVGGHTVTWPSNVIWPSATTLRTDPNTLSIITLLLTNGEWYASLTGTGYPITAPDPEPDPDPDPDPAPDPDPEPDPTATLLAEDTFTAPNGTSIVGRALTGTGTWVSQSGAVTGLVGQTNNPQIQSNRATAPGGTLAAASITLPNNQIKAQLDYEVAAAGGTNDRVNLFVGDNTNNLIVSARSNRIVVLLNGAEVYTDVVGSPIALIGTMEIEHKASRWSAKINGTEIWFSTSAAITGTIVGFGFATGTVGRFADTFRVYTS